MSTKQRKQNRLKNYDYSEPGSYFITICTGNRVNWFGEIEEGRMCLSKIGEIAKIILINVPKHFKHAFIDEFIIMPNHIHLIINIGSPKQMTDPVGDASI